MSRRRIGGEPEDQAGGHRGGEHQPQDVQQVAGAGLRLRRTGSSTGPSRRPAARRPPGRGRRGGARPGAGGGAAARTGTPRPAAKTAAPTMWATSARGEAGEAVVGRHHRRAAGELDQPQGAGGQRDGAQRDQRGRDRPAREARSGVRVAVGWQLAASVVIGLRPARPSAGTVVGSAALDAARRASRHRETPRPMRAMPSGTAIGRSNDAGSTASAAVADGARRRAGRPPSGRGRRRGTGRCRRRGRRAGSRRR